MSWCQLVREVVGMIQTVLAPGVAWPYRPKLIVRNKFPARFDSKKVAEIIEFCKPGISARGAAKEFHCSKGVILRVINKHGAYA